MKETDYFKQRIIMFTCEYKYNFINRLICLVGKVFANGPKDLSLIPGSVIPLVLDTALLNTQQYKVRIKSKLEQSRERNSALPYI